MSEREKASKRHAWPKTSLAEAYEHGFISGSEYEQNRLGEHILKLQQLILLTDPAVSDQEMNVLSAKQWAVYLKWTKEKETDLKRI